MLQWIHLFCFIMITGYGLYLFWRAVYGRYTYVMLGKPFAIKKDLGKQVRLFIRQVFAHQKILRDPKSGIMHLMMFYGFIVLQFGALDILLKGTVNRHLPIPGYEYFILSQETTAGLVLIATGYALYRRYGEKLPRLKKGWKPSLVGMFIFVLMCSILLTMGFERLAQGLSPAWTAPISSLVATGLAGVSQTTAWTLYYAAWWVHLLTLLAFLIYVPQSKHFHLMVAPLNLFLKGAEPAGKLNSIDLEDEEAESFGAGKIEDFTRAQLIDLYACVECGRCTDACPASNTGKTLSPMHLIVKMRDHLTEKGAAVTSRTPWSPSFAFSQDGVHAVQETDPSALQLPKGKITDIRPTMAKQNASWAKTQREIEDIALIGDVMTEEELWACTTCRNCEDQCPVGNRHVNTIIDMRRHLVLMEGNVPSDGQRALQNIERQGNPWGISRHERERWFQSDPDIHVPTVEENPDFDYLLFVGSMGAYDKRSIRVMKSLVKLLSLAEVSFAVLGNKERNSGDTPRRMGNELLFQQLCTENIALFEKYDVRKIITACPHTYNILKNEYPDFGLKAEVFHHSEILHKLVREGKLTPVQEVNERITFHDSCYLGRYNDVFDPPRDILQAIPGIELIEMKRSRENGMCCGAGGGMMWLEEDRGKRVNIARVEQALEVRPSVIGSACPYCLTMMEDGTKMKDIETSVQTKDIAEILLDSVEKKPS